MKYGVIEVENQEFSKPMTIDLWEFTFNSATLGYKSRARTVQGSLGRLVRRSFNLPDGPFKTLPYFP